MVWSQRFWGWNTNSSYWEKKKGAVFTDHNKCANLKPTDMMNMNKLYGALSALSRNNIANNEIQIKQHN